MANKITPQQMFREYGVFNDLRPADGLSGDRRTLTTTDALSAVLEKNFTPDAIGDKKLFGGIVMGTMLSDQPVASNPMENLEYVSQQIELANNPDAEGQDVYYKYKVYVHEADPRIVMPIEELLAGSKKRIKFEGLSLLDRINSLPEASLALGADIPGAKVGIQPGTLVEVIYSNEAKFLNPQIVKVGSKVLDVNISQSSLKIIHQTAGTTTLRSSSGSGSGTSSRDTPSRRAARALAEKQKDLRKQIFESKGNEKLVDSKGIEFDTKTTRGGLEGPFEKKSNRGWTSNAILSQEDQRALKAKFMPEIKAMLGRLGMPLVTFERILRKESGIFDPYAVNGNTSATGLIQFMPKTAKSLGTTVEDLLTMGPKKQLGYVEKYFQKLKANRTISSDNDGVDWYFLVFYPKAIGKPDTYVIGSAYTAEVNPGYADPQHPEKRITRRRVVARWLGKT